MGSRDQPAAFTWDEEASRRWLAQLDQREAPLVPVLDALLEAADLLPGERVLDIGCGAGPTTGAAAVRVGAQGAVTGLDVSPAMVEAGRARFADAQISWLVADAQSYDFPDGSYDVVISRFGVMFFADPARAFGNLASACRAGGRLVLAVWPVRDRSDFFTRPLEVLLATGARLGIPLAPPPLDGGPFSLGDPGRLHQLLTSAGWRDVSSHLDQRTLYLGGPGDDERVLDYLLDLGPARLTLAGQLAALEDAVRTDLRQALQEWKDDIGIGLPGGFLVVTARR